ncbi:MAG: response regulator [Patescibacteria group bacterium]|jgi:DNA-binding response OmpR family regulator
MAEAKKKVLIIEDEAFLAEMYHTKFKELGYQVFVAPDGKQGIAVMHKEKPDLTLLDIIMPDLDGYEVLKVVRQDADLKDLLIVVLSNLGQDEEITKGMQLGADDYLVKSDLTPSQLVEKIETVLARGRTASAAVQQVRVLLIEDTRDIVELYRHRFEKEGFICTVAENGAWGVKTAQTQPFDLILLDIAMPAMNGLEALATLRATPKLEKTPIIVFSNTVESDELSDVKKAGATEVFLKARVTPTQIVNKIRELIAR